MLAADGVDGVDVDDVDAGDVLFLLTLVLMMWTGHAVDGIGIDTDADEVDGDHFNIGVDMW